jgi:hypothetical protein
LRWCTYSSHDAAAVTTLLHQPPHCSLAAVLHAGLVLTPFALVHLAASWAQLSSIALDLTAAGTGGDPLQLVAGLAALTSLRDLSLRLAGGKVGQQ